MCASLKLKSNDEPRCPEVPNATRCAATPGSGRSVKYAVTSRDTSTSRDGSTGLPAKGFIFMMIKIVALTKQLRYATGLDSRERSKATELAQNSEGDNGADQATGSRGQPLGRNNDF